jgi:hypothetical protein
LKEKKEEDVWAGTKARDSVAAVRRRVEGMECAVLEE